MTSLAKNLAALLSGLCTSALAVAIIAGFQRWADFNLFSWTLWFVVPVGAFATGLLAASGYYFGAVRFHAKPTRVLAIAMLAVAAITQLGLYYVRYALDRTVEGDAVSQVVGFPEYTAWMLAHARYAIAPHGRAIGSGVEVGVFGYLIAVLQFIALLVGAFGVYALLADRAFCEVCNRYPRTVEKRDVLLGGDDVASTLMALRGLAPLSAEYFRWIDTPGKTGTAGLELELFECSGCRRRAAAERPKVLREGKWVYEATQNRTTWDTSAPALVASRPPS